MFTFWDRLFGTFQPEEEKPKYGLTHPLKSHSFLWQHFHYYLEIYELWKRSKGFKQRWKAIFGSPANMDQDIRPMLEKRFLQVREGHCRLRFKNYLYVQLGICVAVLTFFTYYFSGVDLAGRTFAVTFILIALINCGALLEQRKWIYYLEYSRLYITSVYLLYLQGFEAYWIVPLLAMVVAEQLFSLSQIYQRYVLQADTVTR